MRKSILVFIVLVFVWGVLPAAAQDDFSCPGAPALGTSVQARTYDAVEPYAEGPGWDVHPAYDEFRLVDFPVQNPGAYFEPIITIYPMKEFAAMSEYAAEQLDAMTTLLANEPQSLVDPDTPLIPIFNAARVFQTRTSYIAFQNGAGFRFITHYAQGFDIFTDENVFYTFQGLTDDGLYWVSVFMPLYTPVLPDTFDYSDDFDWDALVEQYPSYLAEITGSLDTLSPGEFTPDMNLLDEMIASLLITGG
jgi:hypothetical protein